jgi:hypothetical protein
MFAIVRNVRYRANGNGSGQVERVTTREAAVRAVRAHAGWRAVQVSESAPPKAGDRIVFRAGTGEPGSARWIAE